MNINISRDGLEDWNKSWERIKKYKESIQKSISEVFNTPQEDKFLTNDEIDIINKEIPNPEISKIVTEIIDELGKRICNGKNPNYELFNDVCWNIQYRNKKHGNSYLYPSYARQIINKLPDRKNFAYLFDKKLQNSSDFNIMEFRRKRGAFQQTQKLIQPHSTNYTHVLEASNSQEYSNTAKIQPVKLDNQESTEGDNKQTKVKAQYEAISEVGYSKKFWEFIRTENIESEVPFLQPEDVAVATYRGAYDVITERTKVPVFDIRNSGSADTFFKKNGKRDDINSELDGVRVCNGKPFSFYNTTDDISHIMIFSNERGLNAWIQIAIKGKVSQKDAENLIKYLKSNGLFKINVRSWRPEPAQEYGNLSWPKIQNAVMEFFNNK